MLSSLDSGVQVHSMEDVVKFNEENDDRAIPYFGQEHMTMALRRHAEVSQI
ncbi:MAG: hypothetical protein U0V48_01515 [Anaerolineales bacterium]